MTNCFLLTSCTFATFDPHATWHPISFKLFVVLLLTFSPRQSSVSNQRRSRKRSLKGDFELSTMTVRPPRRSDGDGDDDGNVAALSDPVSAYGRQIVCAICALQLCARPPAQIVYDAFELCFKKKSQKDSQSQRRHRKRWPPWWGEADRKRWQVGWRAAKCERWEMCLL